ncbi:MAG: hypothetical protein KKD31_03825, partial [Bacteroidetes bacterium]|nr:hypothetical protein [Bacteroidota bacterium]
MPAISIFTGFNKVEAVRSFAEIVDAIREGVYQREILQLRKLLASGKEDQYREQKRKLVAFTPSGKFEGGRKPALLTDYSGIIVLDVDKTNEKTVELKDLAIQIPFTHSCFISPGGNGLKIFVRVETDASQHLQAFNALKSYYEKSLNVTVDPSGKDITRLCFFSFDEDTYYNEDSQIFSIKEMEKEPDYLQIFQSQVDFTNKIAQFHPGNRNNYIYQLACNCNRMGMPENLTNQFIRQNYDLEAAEIDRSVTSAYKHHPDEYGKNKEWKPKDEKPDEKPDEKKKRKEITANKFTITEEYLREHFTIRYNVVSNKFEYKGHEDEKYKELNENNLYVRLQKDNVNISMNNLVALLKSDFVTEFNPFLQYFEGLPEWDGQTDYIQQLCHYLKTPDRKRLDLHFKKWLVRAVKTAIDDFYYNKQALVLVSTRQNSG